MVRKVFTILQFSISIALIICGIIINRQLYFFRHADTGLNRENVVMVPLAKTIGKQYQAFKKDIQALSGVNQTSTAHYPMYKGFDVFFTQAKGSTESIGLPILSVDEHFISMLKVKWKIPPASPSILSEPKKIVINEATISKLNLNANPIGSKIYMGSSDYEVAAIVKNFNFESLESKINALALFVAPDTTSGWEAAGGCMFVKINAHTDLPALLTAIGNNYKKYDKETPFEYSFMDEAFNEMYKAEDRLASIFIGFTILTVFLACLGLFGLATFTAEQRVKEIGIRKVLGASVAQITTLLSKDFVVLVILALIIASPVAFFTMQKWLQDFAYRIQIQWWMFALAGTLAVLIALLTISFQSVKAALANPVKSLRSE